MALLKNIKVGELLYVPSLLLFPNRTGRFSPYNFSTGIVVNVGVHKTGTKVVQVEYYEAFRYEQGRPLLKKWFALADCMKCNSITPWSKGRDDVDKLIASGWVEKNNMHLIDGEIYTQYAFDTMKAFGILNSTERSTEND